MTNQCVAELLHRDRELCSGGELFGGFVKVHEAVFMGGVLSEGEVGVG